MSLKKNKSGSHGCWQLLWSFLVNFWVFDSLLGYFPTLSDHLRRVSSSFVVLNDRRPCLDKDNWSCVWIFPILGKDRWVYWFFDQFRRFALSLIQFRPSFLGFCPVYHLSYLVELVLYCSLCFSSYLLHFRSDSVVFRPVQCLPSQFNALQVCFNMVSDRFISFLSSSVWLIIGLVVFFPIHRVWRPV